VLPERGTIPVEVIKRGDDLRRVGVTRGGGRALLKRLRRLERDRVIDVYGVSGHHTLIAWPGPNRDAWHPPTSEDSMALAEAALKHVFRLGGLYPEHARLAIEAARIVYRREIERAKLGMSSRRRRPR